jgi:hypothetical protein
MDNTRGRMLALCLLALLISSCTKTEYWSEEVALRDGRTLRVGGAVTRGRDEWFRDGKGPVREIEMSFDVDGRRVTWTRERRGYAVYPAVLDFVDRAPVIVLPVTGFESCNEFAFPSEGLVALRYDSERWSRIPVAQLPEDLRANVLGQSSLRTLKGPALPELIKRNQKTSDACIRIRPPPDPQRDALRARAAQVEAQARTVVATLMETAAGPEQISPEKFATERGRWTGAGSILASCDGVVRGEQVMIWDGIGTSRHGGYRLLFADDVKAEFPPESRMQQVVCDDETVYSALRLDSELLIVYRFTRQGVLADAVKIQLPEAARPAQTRWREVWEIRPDADTLVISLGDYEYTTVATRGGTLSARQTYHVTLPRAD